MPSRVTILMYHFVRDLTHSRYPAIRGLSLEQFRGQLDYLRRHYEIVRMEQVLDSLENGGEGLPPSAALLTFDDGYAEHFQHVFPMLDELGVQGSFFPPARAVLEGHVLDVNKIHFVLASGSPADVFASTLAAIDSRREQFQLAPGAEYWRAFDESSRYDSREVTFVKRVLQKTLPEAARADIVDELFRHYVTSDEAAFARELYVDLDQLRCMRRHGMFVGSHGYAHVWLNAVDRATQEDEVSRGLAFLRQVDPHLTRWVMCYPYGGHDASIREVLRRHGCAAALAVDVGVADLTTDDPLALPRLDTNDLPHLGAVPPVRWTTDLVAPPR
jgi:peptidoglycan/xylan/chitin deacetylase (PgdA/CDA1 family)